MAEPKQGETANMDGQRVQEPIKDISVKPKPSMGCASRGPVRGGAHGGGHHWHRELEHEQSEEGLHAGGDLECGVRTQES